MIVRVWRGRGNDRGIERYCREHFNAVVLPELRSIRGFVGADVLVGGGEVVVATRWESLDAIRAFAGDHPERAVVDPAVAELLDSFDESVAHYTLAVHS